MWRVVVCSVWYGLCMCERPKMKPRTELPNRRTQSLCVRRLFCSCLAAVRWQFGGCAKLRKRQSMRVSFKLPSLLPTLRPLASSNRYLPSLRSKKRQASQTNISFPPSAVFTLQPANSSLALVSLLASYKLLAIRSSLFSIRSCDLAFFDTTVES